MKQLVDATINMHSLGVFHRDIKHKNVLIETKSAVPRVRVIDFGCCCFLKKEPYHLFSGTTSSFCSCSLAIFRSLNWWLTFKHSSSSIVSSSFCLCIVGTPAYAPPEFLLERRYEAGPTTVWQLGALLYELLKGDIKFITYRLLCNQSGFFQDLRELNVSEGKTVIVSI